MYLTRVDNRGFGSCGYDSAAMAVSTRVAAAQFSLCSICMCLCKQVTWHHGSNEHQASSVPAAGVAAGLRARRHPAGVWPVSRLLGPPVAEAAAVGDVANAQTPDRMRAAHPAGVSRVRPPAAICTCHSIAPARRFVSTAALILALMPAPFIPLMAMSAGLPGPLRLCLHNRLCGTLRAAGVQTPSRAAPRVDAAPEKPMRVRLWNQLTACPRHIDIAKPWCAAVTGWSAEAKTRQPACSTSGAT